MFFSHDSNAHDDPKVIRLIDQMGLEGYGAFWVLVELLRQQPMYRLPIASVPRISRTYNITPAKLTQVITGYQLFEVEDDFFFSLSLLRRMQEMKLKYSDRTKKGWLTRSQSIENQQKPFAQAMLSNAKNANEIKENEIKENESKLKSSRTAFAKPTLEQLKEAFSKSMNFAAASHEAEKFLNYYESNGWMVGRNKMKSWQHSVANWIKNSYTNKNNFYATSNNQRQLSRAAAGQQQLSRLLDELEGEFGQQI